MLDLDIIINEDMLSVDMRMVVIEVYDVGDATNISALDNSSQHRLLGKVAIQLDEVIYYNLQG